LAIGARTSNPLRATLDRLGLGDFYDVLAANDIDAGTIGELTEAELRELGLTLGQRKRFLRRRAEGSAQLSVPGRREPAQPGMPPTGERRHLTTMFCDLVDSTPMSHRLDPEDLSEVIREFQDTCSDVITRGSGYIARYMGDGILAYFGYPQAREDDAQSAVRTALEIVAEVGRLRMPDGEALKIRVGIATGLVVVVGESAGVGRALEQSVVGQTPNLAARLQAAAGSGEIVISEETRRLCGTLFDYERRVDIVLKGFPEPISIYRVLGERVTQSRFDARVSGGLNPFVGREQELEALRTRWNAALAGAGQVVLLCGEAGIGKSRLTRAFIDQLGQPGPEILRLNCAAHLTNRALHPIVQEIERRVGVSRTASADARRAALKARVATSNTIGADDEIFLADLLGIDHDRRAELDAATRARRTYDVLARAVEGMSHAGPVLIPVEDTHWADAATLDFLTILIDHIARLPIMLLVTYRPDSPPPWADASGGTTITLSPLDAVAGGRLLESVLGERRLPASVSQTILARAGGIPLFVEELAKTVLEAAGDRSDADTFAALTIPATLHDSLMARLDQLGPVKELAQIGSVIGREFSAAMLQVIAPYHPDIEGGLRRLRHSGLADEAGRDGSRVIAFHHALVQDTAYESLLRKRRRELHRAVAEAMLAQQPAFAGTEPEVIAHHCSRGGLAEPAVSHWLAAGLHALDRAAPHPALAHLRAALEDLQDVPTSAARSKTELAVQMALAPATMAIHGWAAAEVEAACRRASELATAVDDKEALCGATWGLWTHFFIRGEMEPALQTAGTVAAMADKTGSAFLALAAAHALTYSHYSRGEYREALSAGRAGIARYDAESDLRALRAFQLSPSLALPTLLANVHWFLGDDAEADAALARAHAMAEELQHPPALVHCLCVSSYFLLFSEQWTRLAPIAERALSVSLGEGFRFWMPMARISLAFVEAEGGDRGGAIRCIIDNISEFKKTGSSLVMSQFEPRLGELLIASGDPAQAVERLSTSIADAERRVERAYLSELYRVRAVARSALGDLELAARDARDAVAIATAQGAVPLIHRAEASRRVVLGGDWLAIEFRRALAEEDRT
jgi:class 3 adenylate cyclase/tetratricopeptide (TPR) repeat protein